MLVYCVTEACPGLLIRFQSNKLAGAMDTQEVSDAERTAPMHSLVSLWDEFRVVDKKTPSSECNGIGVASHSVAMSCSACGLIDLYRLAYDCQCFISSNSCLISFNKSGSERTCTAVVARAFAARLAISCDSAVLAAFSKSGVCGPPNCLASFSLPKPKLKSVSERLETLLAGADAVWARGCLERCPRPWDTLLLVRLTY